LFCFFAKNYFYKVEVFPSYFLLYHYIPNRSNLDNRLNSAAVNFAYSKNPRTINPYFIGLLWDKMFFKTLKYACLLGVFKDRK